VRAEEGEDLRAAPTECKGSRGRRIVFARLREQGDPGNQRSEVDGRRVKKPCTWSLPGDRRSRRVLSSRSR